MIYIKITKIIKLWVFIYFWYLETMLHMIISVAIEVCLTFLSFYCSPYSAH